MHQLGAATSQCCGIACIPWEKAVEMCGNVTAPKGKTPEQQSCKGCKGTRVPRVGLAGKWMFPKHDPNGFEPQGFELLGSPSFAISLCVCPKAGEILMPTQAPGI